MEITTGTRLGPYEILSRIGAGGMGEVFKARDTRLDRSVAVKVLPAELAHSAAFRTRFEREARTISRLNHPHICTLHDIGEEGGTSYLVMELLEGESLADRLSRGPLPLSEVFRFGMQIADALDRAHRAGVVHRDLKPANVMLTRSGAKLLDFGLAKTSRSDVRIGEDEPTQQKPLTQEGTIVGTFQYMAPEQLEGLEADARTDIFALGAVLYEMATGVRAFRGSTKTSLIAAIVSQDPEPLAEIQPLTPPAFEHVVSRCLAKNPDDRWQSAHDIAEQLRWIADAGSQAGVAAPVVARNRSRERLAWVLAGVLPLLAAAGAGLFSRGARDVPQTVVWDLAPPPGHRFNATGDESGAAMISPDGTMVVYSATDGTKTELWLRVVATGEVRVMAGTQDAAYPFWSPDSRSIGFFTAGWLNRAEVAGGAPTRLAAGQAGRGGSWGPDGTIVFAPDTHSALLRIPASGGTPSPVTKLETGKHTSHRWPWFLPDGRHFLYLAASHDAPTGAGNAIFVGSLDGGAPRLVMQASTNMIHADGYALFARDETILAQPMSDRGELSGEPRPVATNGIYDAGIWRGALSASNTGVLVYHTGRAHVLSTLRWLDRSGKELEVLGEPGSYWDVELSPNAQKVALSVGDPQREIWIRDLQQKTFTRFPVVSTFAGIAVFSPDGTTVYFDDTREGKTRIRARRVTGGGETDIAVLEDYPVVSGLDGPGRNLLVSDRRGRTIRVPIEPPGRPEILSDSKATELYPVYSPDGKWIAFQSDQSGRFEIYAMSSADPAQKWRISSAGGRFPRFRRDGKEIFYIDPSNSMTATAIDSSGDDLSVGASRPLFPITTRPQGRSYDVASDGQRFLVNTITELQSPTAVAVSNWKVRLKK
jgi:Tol biopolymer transport system component